MKNNKILRYLALVVFFLTILIFSVYLCYLQLKVETEEKIKSQIKQTIQTIDSTLENARQAADESKVWIGKKCDETTLEAIRTIVATIPDVRTVSFVKDNEIYCTSVFGGKKFRINASEYPDGTLTLLGGNKITPSKSLVVFSSHDKSMNIILIGIDGYYLYRALHVLGGVSNIHLKIGERFLNQYGKVNDRLLFKDLIKVRSERFNYFVMAERFTRSNLLFFFIRRNGIF